MRDGASTNGVAVRTLAILYPNILDVKCLSHTLDRVGEHFDIRVLNEFTSLWVSMFIHSPKACLCWRELTGCSMKSYSATRWWSKWEVMLMVQFGDMNRFSRGIPILLPLLMLSYKVFFNID